MAISRGLALIRCLPRFEVSRAWCVGTASPRPSPSLLNSFLKEVVPGGDVPFAEMQRSLRRVIVKMRQVAP